MRTALWAGGLAAGVVAMFVAGAGAAEPTAGRFYAFVAGQAVFLACGSALFIQLYGHLLGKAKRPVLREPLAAISEHRRLFTGMHVAVFGAFIACGLVAHGIPQVQDALLRAIKRSVENPHNPLGLAAGAYRSKVVLQAAAVTVAVNFLLGAVASITLPSLILPGAGAAVAFLRACVLGLTLAPTSAKLFHAMAWHTGTALVEMEAYILAAFFGLMVPVYIFSPSKGKTAPGRYARALLLNVRGAVLVLIVLAAVALYEAVEVIMQMP